MPRILTVALVFVIGGCTAAVSPNPVATPRVAQSTDKPPASTPPATMTSSPGLNIGSPGGRAGATALRGESVCSEKVIAHAVAELSWDPAVDRGEEQLVQVTIFSFELSGTVFSEPLEPNIDHLVFEQISGQAVHTWRVLTKHGETWTPTEPGQFVGATCVADG